MNVKVITKLIESEKEGVFANAVILTADDGTTAIETLQEQISAGRQVHFVLMDFVMVWFLLAVHGWFPLDDDDDVCTVCICRLLFTVRTPLA
jgi:hypothetical protein